jgi:WD40 repeat protein
VTTDESNTAQVCEINDWSAKVELKGHTDRVNNAAFSPDSSLIVTASRDRTARIWEARTGKYVNQLEEHPAPIYDVAFSPLGRFIVTASDDDTVRVYETGTRKLLTKFAGRPVSALGALFSPDDKLIVTVAHNTAQVWEINPWTRVAELTGHTDEVNGAAFSPNGKFIVTSGIGGLRAWESGTGRFIKELNGDQEVSGAMPTSESISSSAFSFDSQFLVTTNAFDDVAQVWRTDSWRPVDELIGQIEHVDVASFSPVSNRFILTDSGTGSAWVWEVNIGKNVADESAKPVAELKGLAGTRSVSFSHDGKLILATGSDGITKVYACELCVSGKGLLDLMGSQTTRKLTPWERRLYLHEQPGGK